MLNLRNLRLPASWFQLLLIAVLILGIFFRLTNLDRKLYWHDEAYTSLRISGYTGQEVQQQIFKGQVIGIEDLQKYQRSNSDRGIIDTIKTLASDDAQHPPLYYVLVRMWVEWFGNSVAVTRSLSALISLLVFPCAYNLCLELFESPLVGWVAIALIAASPFHVLYAQEAREYSLWIVEILLSSWMLLRGLRITTKLQNKTDSIRTWLIYAVTLTLSFYTHSLSVLVGIGHGIYVLVRERFRLNKTVIAFLLEAFIAFLCFSPWLMIIIATWSETGSTWAAEPIPLLTWLQMAGINLIRAFMLTIGDFYFDNLWIYISLPIFFLLVSYAIYFLCRHAPQKAWLFVLTLIGTTSLALTLPDLILGGQRATSARYLTPVYLGIQLSLAYLFATQIKSASIFKQKLWQGIMVALISVGIVSCAVSSQADTSWNKIVSYYNRQVAQIVNKAPAPLLISNSFGINFGNIFALSYLLEPKVKFQLVQGNTQPDFENIPKIPPGFSDVFLLNPSQEFRAKIEQEYRTKLELVYNDYHLWLWKIIKR